MMAFDWYPLNPTEFRRDTYHLCAAADGIYRRLIDEYMIARKPLPDNDQALAAIARIGLDEWKHHAAVVRAFFRSKDGKLFHKRCEQELDAQRMRAASRSAQGKMAAESRWAKQRRFEALRYGSHTGSNAHAMLTSATRQSKDIEAEIVEPPKATEKRVTDLSRTELAEIFAKKQRIVSR